MKKFYKNLPQSHLNHFVNSMVKKPSQGFTLIEIALVLVVIGILLAGVFKGQELIRNSRVRNTIEQIKAIQTAHFAFFDRYQSFAGDLTPTQATALGNGLVGVTAGGDSVIAANDSTVFFQNLTATNFISCANCATVTTAVAANVSNTLTNPFGGIYSFANNNDISGTINGEPLRLALSNINGDVLREIDAKLDDGNPTTGSFRNSAFSTGSTSCISGTGATARWVSTINNCSGALLLN